jgi:antitoxin CptB
MPDTPDTTDDLRLRRLRWLCRRGMKELDVLLERFIAGQAQALRAGQWPQLERLWDYLQSPCTCPVGELRGLLHEIGQGRG